MATIPADDLLAQLRWRYATKKFDSTQKIPNEVWEALRTAIQLSPSSYGLEPWKFIEVHDPQLRQRLRPASWNQSQITDASHLLVFAVQRKIGEADVDRLIAESAKARGVAAEQLAPYRNLILGDVIHGPRSAVAEEWATRQAYIALGNAMTAAALLGIDTCPIEGFEPHQYDEILKLTEKGLASKVVLAMGYRSVDDKQAMLPKVRYPLEKVFIQM